MAREDYAAQVALLVRILPYVAKEEIFALKGGTAINLFYRDLPRLSVDIDLTYLPIAQKASPRSTTRYRFDLSTCQRPHREPRRDQRRDGPDCYRD